MTKKESLVKTTLISPVFIGLFGAISGVVISLLIQIASSKSPPVSLMCSIILIWLSFIFLISLMLHRLKDITKGIEKVFKEGSDSRILLKISEKASTIRKEAILEFLNRMKSLSLLRYR